VPAFVAIHLDNSIPAALTAR